MKRGISKYFTAATLPCEIDSLWNYPQLHERSVTKCGATTLTSVRNEIALGFEP